MDFDEFMTPLKKLVNFHDTGKSKIVARKKYPTDANFKLVLENYQECYHCSNAHPEFSFSQRDDIVSERVLSSTDHHIGLVWVVEKKV
jgi:Rieske 2Fe-2S family protein